MAVAQYSPAEQHAIRMHQHRLTREWKRYVCLEEAATHWIEHCAERWRQERMRLMLQLQREEIERYKWIESERAERDLGRDAVFEWINNYAAQWREWFEQEFLEEKV